MRNVLGKMSEVNTSEVQMSEVKESEGKLKAVNMKALKMTEVSIILEVKVSIKKISEVECQRYKYQR